jgi:hypothetical protein
MLLPEDATIREVNHVASERHRKEKDNKKKKAQRK